MQTEKRYRREWSVLAVFALLSIVGCGRDDCFSLGPFGDCASRYPAEDRAATGATGGELRAYLAGNKSSLAIGEKIEIRAEGGVPPYTFRITSGDGTLVDASGLPTTAHTGNWFVAKIKGDVKIRVNDRANAERTLPIIVE